MSDITTTYTIMVQATGNAELSALREEALGTADSLAVKFH